MTNSTSLTGGGYRRVKLGDLLRLRKDVVHPKDRPKGKATFVGLEHIESGTGRRIGSVELDLGKLSGRKPRFFTGDIVYGYLRPYLNKVWVAEFDGVCSVDQHVFQVAPEADREFIAWFMRSPIYLDRAPIDRTPGQLPRIRTEEVATVELGLPPLALQRSTAMFVTEQLARVEQAKLASSQQLDAARELAPACLQEVFGSAGHDWPRKPVAEICERVDYGYTAPADFSLAEPKFLRITDIQDGKVNWESVPGCRISSSEEEANRLADGDIVFARTGATTGKSYLLRNPPRSVFASYLIRLRPGSAVQPDFMYFFFQSEDYWNQVRRMARGGAQPNVNATLLGAIQMPVPSLDQQTQIVMEIGERMAVNRSLLRAAETQRTLLDSLPASVLGQVFSKVG